MSLSNAAFSGLSSALVGRWPGKSALEPEGICHSAVWHMLDVAAVAEVFAARLPLPSPVKQAIILLTALHDIGKLASSSERPS